MVERLVEKTGPAVQLGGAAQTKGERTAKRIMDMAYDCMVASITYQERMFDSEVKQMNVDYLMRMRARFTRWLKEIAATNAPKQDVDLSELADNFTGMVEGAIILSKALADEGLMGRQMRLYRNHIKLLFGG